MEIFIWTSAKLWPAPSASRLFHLISLSALTMINVHQTPSQNTLLLGLLGLLLVVNIWSIWSKSCLVGLQHESSNTGSNIQDRRSKSNDERLVLTFPLHNILICEPCGLEWLLLVIWFRKRSPQCTKIDSHTDALRLCPLSSWWAWLFSGEWEKANFTPICQNWSVNFPQLWWKILSSKPSTVSDVSPCTQHREETKGWVENLGANGF